MQGNFSGAMERGLRVGALLRRAVVVHDIRLGRVVDVLLDEDMTRVLGLDVLCGDGTRRFLALAACEVEPHVIRVESALVLASEELEFYRRKARALTALPHAAALSLAPDGTVGSGDSLPRAV
jgi:hypothetical protein